MSRNYNNCHGCVHAKSEYPRDEYGMEVIVGVTPVRTCGKGNNAVLSKWWDDNGHKKTTEELDTVDCYEDSEFGKLLSDMLSSTEEMLEKLKENGL